MIQHSCPARVHLPRLADFPGANFRNFTVAFALALKPYRIGLVFTHKNSDSGAISVTKRSCAATISKAESHISDRCSYNTGQLFVWARKDSLYIENIRELK